jgi:hypothetical protein
MELMLGENESPLPIWSQTEPVPFHFVSMYPEGTKLGKGRLQIEKFAELAIDFGRTPCGAALPNFFQKASTPQEARYHFFVASSFRAVNGSSVFSDAAEWFARNGFVSSVQLDEMLQQADENRDIAITIPAVREGEGIKKLITIVVPEYSENPGAAIFVGAIRSFFPNRFSDAITPSFFNTRNTQYKHRGSFEPIFGVYNYTYDDKFLTALYLNFSQKYLERSRRGLDASAKRAAFDLLARKFVLLTATNRKNCKFVF